MKLYLSSEEYKDFKEVKELVQYKIIDIEKRIILMSEINSPILGQKYGWGEHNIKTIYLTNRFEGDSIGEIDKFPFYVDVLILKTPNSSIVFSLSEFINIAWACLYNNKIDAINYRII